LYDDSSLFRKPSNWRERKTSRIEDITEMAGTFAEGAIEKELGISSMNREKVKIDNGLFGDDDVKEESERKVTLPGGLFDDSDEEKDKKNG
jgi:hypothetical protein